jgi:hypothetical protein
LLTDGIRFLPTMTKIARYSHRFGVFSPGERFFFFTGIGYYLYSYITQGRFTNVSVFLTIAVFVFG